MSEQQRTADWRIGTASAAALVVVGAVVWGIGAATADGDPASGSSPTPSGSPTSAVSPSPATPTGTASQSPGKPPKAAKPVRAPKPIHTDLGKQAAPESNISVQVVRVESVAGEARGIGEVAGPAVRITLKVVNDSAQPLDLTASVMTAYFGASDLPAGDLSGPGVRALPSSLGAGATTTARYVFAIPKDKRGKLRVDFSYAAEVPVVIFRGKA